ncbi:MAG: glutamate-5-semialdehyde dehydrogenase [Lentisphaerae bacterium]|jgi:glutamate-5-semialdehyde dehydrogenase|nr:glutamate-5-semialdehyde dehydrogenase [Lentisphaerota bacterium]MBT7846225.1 glutamate-5-semialdehyde dehydrogenase [Lentisphaerota bacterium]
MTTHDMAKAAKNASIHLAAMSTDRKNAALAAVADALAREREQILAANAADLQAAKENDLASPLLKRLKFDDKKLADVVDGIESLIGLPDPVGQTQSATELDAGLNLYRVTCPIGVIGVIFESRPDALVQISTLCLKSGNAVLLKGGSEAVNTNRALAAVITEASVEAGLPEGWLQLLETRADVQEMLSMDENIDLLVPRGSNEFVKYIMDNSNIPVLGHADGICHAYVDAAADVGKAVAIAVDSKCQYVAVCNALETLLVHASIAEAFLPVAQAALTERGVELRGCSRTRQIIEVDQATEEDWRTEYLELILSIRVVDSLDDAVAHINTYGSGHTDVIVTEARQSADRFFALVDSGDIFWNCSTRFSDGFRYGLGAEVGISTNKIHARGPVGLDGLVIYQWRLIGNGQTVAPYADGEASFTHKPLDAPCPL